MAGMESLFGGLSKMGSMVGLPAALDSAPSRQNFFYYYVFLFNYKTINVWLAFLLL
jgi:hypothetical protein